MNKVLISAALLALFAAESVVGMKTRSRRGEQPAPAASISGAAAPVQQQQEQPAPAAVAPVVPQRQDAGVQAGGRPELPLVWRNGGFVRLSPEDYERQMNEQAARMPQRVANPAPAPQNLAAAAQNAAAANDPRWKKYGLAAGSYLFRKTGQLGMATLRGMGKATKFCLWDVPGTVLANTGNAARWAFGNGRKLLMTPVGAALVWYGINQVVPCVFANPAIQAAGKCRPAAGAALTAVGLGLLSVLWGRPQAPAPAAAR